MSTKAEQIAAALAAEQAGQPSGDGELQKHLRETADWFATSTDDDGEPLFEEHETALLLAAADRLSETERLRERVRELEGACQFAVDWLTSYNIPPQVTENERDEVLAVLYRALVQRGERSEVAEAIAATLSAAARTALAPEETG